MMKRTLLSLCLLLTAMSSQAVVVFNTFGNGDSTKTFGYGFGDVQDTRIATQFTPTETGTLDTVVIKLLPSATAANATISLFEDSGNDIGSLMTIFTTLVSSGGLTTFTNSNSNIQLNAGNKYWIEAKTTVIGSGLYSGWYTNNQGVIGLNKFGNLSGSKPNYQVGTAEVPALRVTAMPVPEPTTLVALSLLASVAAIRRRKTN